VIIRLVGIRTLLQELRHSIFRPVWFYIHLTDMKP
jgi:hypothetical protein